MTSVPSIFGSMVFNDEVMRDKLPKDTYQTLKKTIKEGSDLDIGVANVVANAMKDWAIEKGATHYTHWFQPMTGVTAEKHESFISPRKDGTIIMEFSGKELIKGEPDASSFPSGGLRATFEARGYTAWDPTSYAFIKDHTLCIPTAFYSYSGEVLDKKTPLLRSIECLSRETSRILRLFGKETSRVIAQVGPEQEYFLIDRDEYLKREDLIMCGRTLFGAKPPKGQELEDHYFGVIRPRVAAFMRELDEELWKLGVFAKTKHNETAPAQHELAPIYCNANAATDQNQLTMELMKTIAERHNLACLLHEKPFLGVNGSGKHNNWSISTAEGENLLSPGHDPFHNKQFLLFLAAVIQAVDDFQDLLRISIASAGNDHRLGAAEAPPAIVSMFLGDELSGVLDAFERGEEYRPISRIDMRAGVQVLPEFKKDTTDRNRTSPFAFTGNKFEFRMLGSSSSIADPNTILNTIVSEVLSQFADKLEGAVASGRAFEDALDDVIRNAIRCHKRIIFNGDGYTQDWVREAEARGLLNLKTTPDALPYLVNSKNLALFTKHKIFSETEIRSRYEILMENYVKVVNIEALTMIDMAEKQILPACIAYTGMLAETECKKREIGILSEKSAEFAICRKCSNLTAELNDRIDALKEALDISHRVTGIRESADYTKDSVIGAMNALREVADKLESIVGERYWPYPTYRKLLFDV